MGWCGGAQTALKIALEYPQMVEKLVIWATWELIEDVPRFERKSFTFQCSSQFKTFFGCNRSQRFEFSKWDYTSQPPFISSLLLWRLRTTPPRMDENVRESLHEQGQAGICPTIWGSPMSNSDVGWNKWLLFPSLPHEISAWTHQTLKVWIPSSLQELAHMLERSLLNTCILLNVLDWKS